MSTDKTTLVDFEPAKQRLVRYTIATINAVTLMGTILLVTWILGKIISALHALVFSLAFAESPDQPQKDFPMLEDSLKRAEIHTMLEQPGDTPGRGALYSLDSSDWGQ